LSDGVHPDLSLPTDHTGAELQAGDVPLPDSPDGKDEAQLVGGEAALVGVRHDGRVENGGRLDRILLGQKGAEQLTSFGR
jgi:hypothetical protein